MVLFNEKQLKKMAKFRLLAVGLSILGQDPRLTTLAVIDNPRTYTKGTLRTFGVSYTICRLIQISPDQAL